MRLKTQMRRYEIGSHLSHHGTLPIPIRRFVRGRLDDAQRIDPKIHDPKLFDQVDSVSDSLRKGFDLDVGEMLPDVFRGRDAIPHTFAPGIAKSDVCYS